MSDQIQFYLDEHVHPAIATGLRLRGIGVLTISEAGMLGASDNDLLSFALSEQRTVFTQDADFLRLHAMGLPHAGIIYAHQRTPIGAIVRGLVLIHQVLEPDDMANHIEFL